jgi:ATP-dependent DNA ligase
LDGELYTHKLNDDFNKLMSLVRKSKPTDEDIEEAKELIEYHVYDVFLYSHPTAPAMFRKLWLSDNVTGMIDKVYVVPYEMVYNMTELNVEMNNNLVRGYEGTIVRIPNEVYENKRSKNLVKIKSFITEEFTIIDILPGKGNRSDIAGTIVVKVGNKEVGCSLRGTWYTAKAILREKDDLIGTLATIRHFGMTPDKSLRFPVCIDINRPD